MIKLIVSDLDGTLVPEGTSSLPPELVNTLDRVMESGIHFAASSGRQMASIRKVFSSLRREPLICSLNGGVVSRGEEILSTDPLPQEAARSIAQEAHSLGTCDIILETAQMCWVYGNTHGMVPALEERNYDFQVISSLSQLEGAVIKVAAYFPLLSDLEDYAARMEARWGKLVTVARSGEHWVDCNVSDKGKGLKALWQLLDVKPEETLAFGDNVNDQAMLELAGSAYVAQGCNPVMARRFPVTPDPRLEMEKILLEMEKNTCNPR